MSAKPGSDLEEFAGTAFSALDSQRTTLIDEVRTVGTRTGQQASATGPILAMVEQQKFLSHHLASDALSAVKSRDVGNVIGDLEALLCRSRTQETCRAIIAYFLKYRYLELSDLTQVQRKNPSAGAAIDPILDIPGGADTLWSDLRSGTDSIVSAAADMLPSRITAVPWLGSLRKDDILYSINWLCELGFLEFRIDPALHAVARKGLGAVPVLACREEFEFLEPNLSKRYQELVSTSRHMEKRRSGLVQDLGTGIRAVGGYETYNLIADSSPNDILRISTYHLRTVIGERGLADWLADKETLRLRIMCLGPTKIESLTEGADPTSLIDSLVRGIQSFRAAESTLPRHQRRQIEIRVLGDIEAEAYFRGAILCDAQDQNTRPKRIIATVWPHGEVRASYGEVLKLQGDSNIARLIVQYYDQAWRNAVPLSLYGRAGLISWCLSSIRKEIVAALVVVLLTLLVLAVRPDWQGDAAFGLLSLIPLLSLAVYDVVRRGARAWRLSRLIAARS
jgi:hypothetical protein